MNLPQPIIDLILDFAFYNQFLYQLKDCDKFRMNYMNLRLPYIQLVKVAR